MGELGKIQLYWYRGPIHLRLVLGKLLQCIKNASRLLVADVSLETKFLPYIHSYISSYLCNIGKAKRKLSKRWKFEVIESFLIFKC